MQLLKYAKIALLIVILAEEIRNAIDPKYTVKMRVNPEIIKSSINEYFSNYNSNLD